MDTAFAAFAITIYSIVRPLSSQLVSHWLFCPRFLPGLRQNSQHLVWLIGLLDWSKCLLHPEWCCLTMFLVAQTKKSPYKTLNPEASLFLQLLICTEMNMKPEWSQLFFYANISARLVCLQRGSIVLVHTVATSD